MFVHFMAGKASSTWIGVVCVIWLMSYKLTMLTMGYFILPTSFGNLFLSWIT